MRSKLFFLLLSLLIILTPSSSFASLDITVNGSTHTIAADETGDPAINVDAENVTVRINSGVTVSATDDAINEGKGGVVIGKVCDGAPWDIFSMTELENNGTISGSTLTTGIGVNVCADSWGTDTSTITTLNNNGLISGQFGVYVSEQDSLITTLNNNSGGVISGSNTAIRIHGGTIGNINNSGTISSTGSYGIHLFTNSENVVSHGVLSGTLTNSGNISGNIAIYLENNSTIGAINNSGTITGSGGTAIDLDNSANAFTITNYGTINGAVDLGINDLTINGSSSSITGAVTGTGDVTLNGTFSNASTFNTANFNIASSGTLNIKNDITTTGTFTNDGILSVGAGESYTITGDYTQTANGMYRTGISSTAVAGKLNVTGTADLSANNKIDVDVSVNDTLADGNTITGVLSAGTLTAGTPVVSDNSAMWDFTGTVNGNAIDLKTVLAETPVEAVQGEPAPAPVLETPEPLPLTTTKNIASGAAEVLTAFLTGELTPSPDMQVVLNHMGALSSSEEVAAAVHQTLPAVNGHSAISQTNMTNEYLVSIIGARLSGARGLAAGDTIFEDKYFWGKLFGGSAEQSERNGVDGYDTKSYGAVVGVDAKIDSDITIGVAFSYTDAEIESDSDITDTGIDLNAYQLLFYGKKEFSEAVDLNVSAACGINNNESYRHISINGLNRTALADYDADSIFINAKLNHISLLSESSLFISSFSVFYNYLKNESYAETGAGSLNLENDSVSADSLIVSLGGKLDCLIKNNQNFYIHLELGYDLMCDQSSVSSTFEGATTSFLSEGSELNEFSYSGGASFLTEGIEPDEFVYSGGFGYGFMMTSGFQVNASYSINGREDLINQVVSINCRFPF